jgi:hypothetical protein
MNSKLFLNSDANLTATLAITAGAECRAGDQELRIERCYQPAEFLGGLFGFICKSIIAAYSRGNDFQAVAEPFLESTAGSDRARLDARPYPPRVFTADLAEELVEIMDDPHGFHSSPAIPIKRACPDFIFQPVKLEDK